ncbi:MAG: hypothetical protein KGI55_12755, partial [Gammaproteobacteria bacterium]|nr:hypothetical protein [Gammaproteobacteria bacterium]
MKARRIIRILGALFAWGVLNAAIAAAHEAPGFALAAEHRDGFDLKAGSDVISVRWLAPNLLRVHFLPRTHA